MELSPGQVVDRYTVEALLGEGGMAVVYRVRHTTLGTLHALKVLSGVVGTVRKRLLQEGRVQAAMRHPNVVGVTDVISIDGQPGLVMEYIDGPSLDRLLKRRRLTLEQADKLAEGILEAVSAAHALDLVHRDLKPANIMLAVQRGQLIPKITDFGLAKLLAAEGSAMSTRSGVAMGTPPFMAPEQIQDASRADKRADVFSLGAILYELATGSRCFQGADSYAVFTAVMEGIYVEPKVLEPKLPDRMLRAIEVALKREPKRRPADAAELLEVWRGGRKPARDASKKAWDDDLLAEARSMGSGGETVLTGGSQGSSGSEPTYGQSEDTWSDAWISTSNVTPWEPSEIGDRLVPELRGPPPTGSTLRSVGLWIGGLVLGTALVAVAVAGWIQREGPVQPSPPTPEVPALPERAPPQPVSEPRQPGKPESR